MRRIMGEQVNQQASWQFTVIAKSDKPEQPLVLSKADWYPPEGVSALPVAFQKAVPEKMRYWEEADTEKRHAMLDGLREAWDGESLESLAKRPNRVTVRVTKTDGKLGLVYGIAMTANELDSWGDFERPQTIEETAHEYLIRMWEHGKPDVIGVGHERPIDAIPVESYIWNTEPGWLLGTEKIEENKIDTGDWVLVTKVQDKAEFNKIESGEYTGYSIQGVGERTPVKRLPSDVKDFIE